jgi:hypothetical protein
MALIVSTLNDIKERMSVAVVTLVAARAGCQLTRIEVDRDSVDVTIRPIQGEPICIDAQLKSSSVLARKNGHLTVNLPKKNYNDLVKPVVGVPRILIVLDLHSQHDLWLREVNESLVTQRLAYWEDLFGREPTDNATRKTVHVPLAQGFTADGLKNIIQRCHTNIQNGIGGVK